MIGFRALVFLSLTSMALAQAAPAGQGAPSGSQQPPASSAPAAPSGAQEQKAQPAAPPAPSPAMPAAPSAAPKTPAKPAETSKSVPESAPVITIEGVCTTTPAAPKTAATAAKKPAAPACKTVITRAEWERLVNTVRPNLPPSEGRRLAQEYVTFAALANAGRKAGLDKSSEVQEKLRLARMQILANAYTQDLQKKYSQSPAAEIENYYNNNKAQFEEVTLKRIYVPKPAPVEGKPVDEAAAKVMAQKIHDRAAAGEDFDKLQKEAFEETGNKGTAPNTDIGDKRRGTLPPKHEEEVFKLKPGEVSPAYEEPSGFFIYKVLKTGVAPLDQVKPEIQRTIESEKMRTAMEQLRGSVKPVFNEAYFGPVQPAVGPAAPHAGHQAGGHPAGASAAPSQPAPAAPAQPQPASPAPAPSSSQPPTSTPSPK